MILFTQICIFFRQYACLTRARLVVIALLFSNSLIHAATVNVVTYFDINTLPQSFVPLTSKGYAFHQHRQHSGIYNFNPVYDRDSKNVIFFECSELAEQYSRSFANKKAILFVWEPGKRSEKFYTFFDRVYTWDDDLVDNLKFFKFHYPFLEQMIESRMPFEKKKLCTMIVRNWFNPVRVDIAKFFESRAINEFEYYGVPFSENHTAYRGSIPGYHSGVEKVSVLNKYRFCICFENSSYRGYVTEKIFDCFKSGCIPIYFGAPNITDYVPSDCFIDFRDFSNHEELYQFIKSMPKGTYENYIKNIQNFLSSEKGKVFKIDHFYETFLNAIEL